MKCFKYLIDQPPEIFGNGAGINLVLEQVSHTGCLEEFLKAENLF